MGLSKKKRRETNTKRKSMVTQGKKKFTIFFFQLLIIKSVNFIPIKTTRSITKMKKKSQLQTMLVGAKTLTRPKRKMKFSIIRKLYSPSTCF